MKTFSIEIPETEAPVLILNEQEIHLVKQLAAGSLDKEYQRQFFDLLKRKICRVGALSMDADPHRTAMKEGMRLVGIYLNYIAETPYDQL